MKVQTSQGEIPIAEVANLPVPEAAQEALDKMEASRMGYDVGKPDSRPSLEVETEVHDNLRPRIEAHLGRMRAWDLRKLPVEQRGEFLICMGQLETAFSAVGNWLETMRVSNFIAKTTPVTRLASKLSHGSKVSLRDDQRAVYAKLYSAEQLDSLSVVKVTDTHVQLMADDGSNVGLVKIIHVVPK